jgi:Ca-activated chloride channel family protein
VTALRQLSFQAPARLWLLLGVAVVLIAYVIVQFQRRSYAARFATPKLLGSVAPGRPRRRRHLATTALVLAMALLVLGFARPVRRMKVPREQATIILAIDVSDSMGATDVPPSRMAVALNTAHEFVAGLPGQYKLGLISFAPSADVLVAPTTDRAPVQQSLDQLELAPGTATGEAIFAALATIAATQATETHRANEPAVEQPAARIVVLSDGKVNAGRSSEEAARAAAEARIPVSTIAYGTDEGTVVIEGRTIEVPVDRQALREVAEITNGSFFEAATGEELKQVYEDIGSQIGYVTERRNVTSWFLGAALVLGFVAAAGALAWTSRLP